MADTLECARSQTRAPDDPVKWHSLTEKLAWIVGNRLNATRYLYAIQAAMLVFQNRSQPSSGQIDTDGSTDVKSPSNWHKRLC